MKHTTWKVTYCFYLKAVTNSPPKINFFTSCNMGSGSEVLFRNGALALNHFPDFPYTRNQGGNCVLPLPSSLPLQKQQKKCFSFLLTKYTLPLACSCRQSAWLPTTISIHQEQENPENFTACLLFNLYLQIPRHLSSQSKTPHSHFQANFSLHADTPSITTCSESASGDSLTLPPCRSRLLVFM